MDFVIMLVLTAILIAPVHLAIEREVSRIVRAEDDRNRRVVREPAQKCDALGPVIGFYNGATIYENVTYEGMVYAFDRLAPPRYDRMLEANELYLDPGLVYVTRV